ncbi:glycoside hydrolase/deacetylase, partial [Armillaria gallica]
QTGSVITSCTVPNTTALIFDDGPYIYLYVMFLTHGVVFRQNIVDMLDAKGVKGIFFVSTYYIDFAFSLAGFSPHSNFSDSNNLCSSLTDNEFQLTTNAAALEKILGVKVVLMGPPYGSYTDSVLQVAAAHNQSMIIWDFDSGDSIRETAVNSEKDYDTLVAKHPNMILTLNHETIGDTTILPHALDDILGAGYNLMTVTECLGLPTYLSVAVLSVQD